MRSIIITIASLITGYVVGNLEYKTLEEILENLSGKTSTWISVIKSFIGETLNEYEGFDSDQIKINIDSFVYELEKKIDKFSEIESLNEKIAFAEKEIKIITDKLLDKK